jgi:hypothetical protein
MGRVVAVDLDTPFLDGHGRANPDVRQLDMVTGAVDDGPSDLVHARAVLEHIPDRPRAGAHDLRCPAGAAGWCWRRLTSAPAAAAALAHYVGAPEHAPLMERIYHAAGAVFAAAGGRCRLGPKHIRMLKDTGLACSACWQRRP